MLLTQFAVAAVSVSFLAAVPNAVAGPRCIYSSNMVVVAEPHWILR